MWIISAITCLGWIHNINAQYIWVGHVTGKPKISYAGKVMDLRIGRVSNFETIILKNGDKVVLHKDNTKSCELSKSGKYQFSVLQWKTQEKPLSARIWAYLEVAFGFSANPDNKNNLVENLAGISRGSEDYTEMFLPMSGNVNRKEALVFWWPNPNDEKFDLVLTSKNGEMLYEKKGVVGEKISSSSYFIIKKLPKNHTQFFAKIRSQSTGLWSPDAEIWITDNNGKLNEKCTTILDDVLGYQMCESEYLKQQGYINQAAHKMIITNCENMEKLTMMFYLIQ